jgi:hypothetical protein
MSDQVIPFRPAQTTVPARSTGYLGLHWVAVKEPHTKRWEAIGEPPDRTGVMHARVTVPHLPRGADQEATARVIAQLLNDLDPGAAALMEDALLREGQIDA